MIQLLALALLSHAHAAEYVLVINETIPETALERRDLRKLVSRQRCCWSDGLEVALVFPPLDGDAMDWFTREFVGLEPAVYKRYLLERCYRTGCTPMVGADDLSMAQAVASQTPGAVTIATPGHVPDGMRLLIISD